MDRTDLYMRMVDAFTRYQGEVALILEAKAAEAEKSRNWIRTFLHDGGFDGHREQLKASMAVHERLIEVIDGIVKMESALARHLKLLIAGKDEGGSDGGLFGDLFGADGGTDGGAKGGFGGDAQ
mgnify:CR=1 FL=1